MIKQVTFISHCEEYLIEHEEGGKVQVGMYGEGFQVLTDIINESLTAYKDRIHRRNMQVKGLKKELRALKIYKCSRCGKGFNVPVCIDCAKKFTVNQ